MFLKVFWTGDGEGGCIGMACFMTLELVRERRSQIVVAWPVDDRDCCCRYMISRSNDMLILKWYIIFFVSCVSCQRCVFSSLPMRIIACTVFLFSWHHDVGDFSFWRFDTIPSLMFRCGLLSIRISIRGISRTEGSRWHAGGVRGSVPLGPCVFLIIAASPSGLRSNLYLTKKSIRISICRGPEGESGADPPGRGSFLSQIRRARDLVGGFSFLSGPPDWPRRPRLFIFVPYLFLRPWLSGEGEMGFWKYYP